MKKLLVMLVLVSLILSLAVVVNAAAPTSVRLTWTGNTTSTQTINWTTDTSTTLGKIQYKKSSSSTYTTVTAAAGVVKDGVKLWNHTLTSLSSGTTYNYRVGDGTNWSPYYTFKTAASGANEFSFIIFGDSSNDDVEYEDWTTTVTNAYAANPGAKFFMHTGDIVQKGQVYADWSPWLTGAANVVANIPAMLTVAKDECSFGEDPETEQDILDIPYLFMSMWNYPQNGSTNYKGQNYSFDYGNVHIAVLNTQVEGYFFGDITGQQAMLNELAAWLDADLTATTKTWKIVVWHIPMYPTSSDRAFIRVRDTLQPVLDEHQVDVVFDGHCHSIARTFPIRDNKVKATPAEGTVYYQVGTSNGNPKEDTSQKYWHHFFYTPQDFSNYIVVEVDGSELEIKSFSDDGRQIDEYEIDKADPSDCTVTMPPGEFDEAPAIIFGTVQAFADMPEEDENIPGKWYVSVYAVATLAGGYFDPATNLLSYDDGEIEVQLTDSMFMDPTDKKFVSVEGLLAAGFDEAYYDEDVNAIFISKWRE